MLITNLRSGDGNLHDYFTAAQRCARAKIYLPTEILISDLDASGKTYCTARWCVSF